MSTRSVRPACDTALEEQIGQCLVAGFQGHTPSPQIVDLIENHHLGGVILFSRNIQDAAQLLELTTALQETARRAGHRYPLLIAVDQENGIVRRLSRGATEFPGNMALGAAGSESLAYEVAWATGRELRAAGVNFNLAPVLDVNNNPSNPVIGVRSFGEDPGDVARLGAAAVRGYKDAGVITSVKHFPGHGDTATDSHLALPVVPHDLSRLEAVELPPFIAGIEAGAESVMIAHLHLPSLMPDDGLPSTVSPEVIRGLLREHLGFRGLVVSDCLEMSAVADGVGTQQALVLALAAGTDLVFVSHTYERQLGGLHAVRAALESGQLSEEVVRTAAGRVQDLKARYLSWDRLPDPQLPEWVAGREHQELSERAYAAAVTVVRDQSSILPLGLSASERVVLLYPAQEPETGAADSRVDDFLVESFRQRLPNIEAVQVSVQPSESERHEALRRAEGVDTVIYATMSAQRYVAQAELMRSLVARGQRVVGLALREPYYLLAFPELGAYVAAYGSTPPALEAAVRVLFGESEPMGRLPVSLPGLHSRGDGITGPLRGARR